MAKKKTIPEKTKPVSQSCKGLAGAAEAGGGPVRVAIDRFAVQLPLRDMFAVAALNAIIAVTTHTGETDGEEGLFVVNKDLISTVSYSFADAMLRAREAK